MLAGVGDSLNLGVDNVAGTLQLIPKFCMLGFLGCSTMRIGNGPGTAQGTILLPPLLPTNPECHYLHRLLLCIPVVPMGTGSSRMVRLIAHMRKLLGLSGMLA